MSKRVSVRKFESDEVQGEGSFIVLSSLKMRELKEMRKTTKKEGFDDLGESIKIIVMHILDWNWVDDDGKPLAVPTKPPASASSVAKKKTFAEKVGDELTAPEVKFITECMTNPDPKN